MSQGFCLVDRAPGTVLFGRPGAGVWFALCALVCLSGGPVARAWCLSGIGRPGVPVWCLVHGAWYRRPGGPLASVGAVVYLVDL